MGKIEGSREFRIDRIASEPVQHLAYFIEAVGIFTLQNLIALGKPRTLSEVIPFN